MSKYRNLTYHLSSLGQHRWRATFQEISDILGFELPQSAYEYPAWWANQAGGHAQSSAWQDAGWRTENLDLEAQCVTFIRYPGNALAIDAPSKGNAMPAFNNINALAGQNALDIGESSQSLAKDENIPPLTISQAKIGLSKTFGVPIDSIEIIVRG